MDGSMIWEWVIKSIIIILALTVGFAYATLYERKALARIQVRIGPNRVGGKFALLQPVADAFKLIFKEEMIPVASINSSNHCSRAHGGAGVDCDGGGTLGI